MSDDIDAQDTPDTPDIEDDRSEVRPTEVVVRPLPERPADWRSRALAVREALPQLARNPVVVGATAAAATVVARLAVDVARRAVLEAVPGRPATLDVQGSIVHEVHVVQHVVHHVVHHYAPPTVALWIPVRPPPRP
jgi:hypothetical protein